MDKKIRLFLGGMSSVLTLTPTAPTFAQREPIMNDREAQADDWQQVGDDLNYALEQHASQKAG